MRRDAEARAEALARADPAELGRGAATVFRDLQGRRRRPGASSSTASNGKDEPVEEEIEPEPVPLARYDDDRELNDFQKSRPRWGDPMAQAVDEELDGGQGSNKKPGAVSKRSRPRPTWPNRFGILPGPHWDGVERGTGFESRLAVSKTRQKEAQARTYAEETRDL